MSAVYDRMCPERDGDMCERVVRDAINAARSEK